MADCLLTYQFSTDPDPIQVSTPQIQVNGRVNTGVFNMGPFNPTPAVYCNQIVIAVPVGDDAASLFSAAPTPVGSVSTNKWALSSLVVKKGSELGLPDDETYATFTYNCVNATDYLINYNLVFGVFGFVNQLQGPFNIQIMETSGTTSDPDQFTNKQGTFTLNKALPQFYLRNFIATAPAAPTVPATDFPNGSAIVFGWESNGTYFQLFAKNQAIPVYAGTATTYTLTTGVSRGTTFILIASVTGNPGQDTPQGGYEPIYHYDALTITVSNPDLAPQSVAIAGTLSAGGNTTLSGQLGVSGATTLANASISGTLGVTGATTLTSAQAGSLTVNGNATMSAATVNNALTVSGLAALNGGLRATAGQASVLTGAQAINPGSYTARTDGLVLGFCWWPSSAGLFCLCTIWGSNSDGVSVGAIGGNVAHFNSDWGKIQSGNAGSFLMPVRNGSTWGVSVGQDPGNQAAAPTAFYWIPLGTATSGQTFERTGEAPPPPQKLPVVRRNAVAKDPALVLELVSIIESLMDRSMSSDQRQRLTTVLTKMNTDDFTVDRF